MVVFSADKDNVNPIIPKEKITFYQDDSNPNPNPNFSILLTKNEILELFRIIHLL